VLLNEPERTGGKKGRTFTETARRAQIVDEAIRTIAEVGYARASLGQIANRLGTSKGLLSYHFASKDELIAAIIAETIARGAEFVGGRMDPAASPRAQLRGYIEGEMAFLGTHRDHARALVEIYNARAADYAPHARTFVSALEALLVRGQRNGEFRDFSPRVMAISIRAAIEIVPHIIASDPTIDLDEYGRELAALFEHATANVALTASGGRQS
jgi:AcrR family transcriptional regulator